MSNAKRGIVNLKDMDGVTHILKYDMNALVEVQEKLEIETLDELFQKLDGGKLDFKTIRVLMWAGFLHSHTDDDGNPTITIKQVGHMDFALKEMTQAIQKAFTIFVGIEEKNAGKPTPKTAAAPNKG